ncbi:MAG: hypothetical protein WBA18_16775 [Terracidiphilus sp.]
MQQVEGETKQKRVAPLTVVLGIVFVFFCSVLVYVYAATKRANPVMLDAQGHPIGQTSQSPSGGTK